MSECNASPPPGIEPLDEFLPFSPPLIGDEEIRELTDTLSSGWLTTGPKTERFEQAVAEYVGAKHAVAVNSCTAALHLALHVLGVGPSYGVITTPYTFASTGHVIQYLRALPFLVDVDDETLNLSPTLVKRFIETECSPDASGRPQHKDTGLIIKAVLPVHYGGRPCDMDAFGRLAEEHNLAVVEDAAHAIGASHKGRKIGSISDVTCFSFYATKNITTGEGGMAVTDDRELADRMRVLSMYGISDARRIWARYTPKGSWAYDIVELGYKYNMMDIQAAIGLHQLKRLDGFIARRKSYARIYNEALAGLPGVRTPDLGAGEDHAWHLYPLRLNLDELTIDRDDFIEHLKALNIGASVLFIPLHLHTHYRDALGYDDSAFPVAEQAFQGMVNLPISPALPEDRLRRAAGIVAQLIEACQK